MSINLDINTNGLNKKKNLKPSYSFESLKNCKNVQKFNKISFENNTGKDLKKIKKFKKDKDLL